MKMIYLEKGEIKHGEEINVVVPTGNFGNILAAFYAEQNRHSYWEVYLRF